MGDIDGIETYGEETKKNEINLETISNFLTMKIPLWAILVTIAIIWIIFK